MRIMGTAAILLLAVACEPRRTVYYEPEVRQETYVPSSSSTIFRSTPRTIFRSTPSTSYRPVFRRSYTRPTVYRSYNRSSFRARSR